MELKSIKKKFDRILALVLTIVALMAGQNVWATTKTVTYTLSREKVEGRNYWALTHSGSTPFDGTTTVQSQPEDYYTQATFHLPDNFIFTFNWNGGTVTNVSGTYFMCQNENVKFSLTWSGTSRYVTNVKVTDDQGNPSSLNGSGTATTDYNYAEQGSASYTLKTYANFVRLVITYSDAPGLSVFQSAGTNTYNIVSKHDLRHLADYVNNGGNNCYGLTFLQTKNITCDNTYIPIAHRTSITDETSFNGTYDGQGYTVSGITANYSGDYVGMFGYNCNKGTIRNVVLASSTFTGYSSVGGIVGSNDGTVENCRVESSVNINAATNGSSNHGGIAGLNRGLVIGCISAATVSTSNNYTYSMANGGIVGHNNSGRVRNCLYTGTNVSVIANKGAIVGFDENNKGTFTNNYYTNIDLGGVDGSDQNGARRARTVTLVENITLVGDETIYNYSGITAIGTGNYALSYNDGTTTTIYSGQYQTLSLSYDAAAIPDGYDVLLSVTQTASGDAVTFTDHGDHTYTIPMPAADITVSVTQIPVISYIDADGNPQSHACIPIVSDTHSYKTLGRTEGWYVVNSDVTDDYSWSSSFLDQAVHIILCDGKTLSRKASESGHRAIEVTNGSLSIYGQSLGTGRLMVFSKKGHGIYAKEDICLNGGTVSTTSSSGAGIFSNNGDVTIHRGNIAAQGGYYGIRSYSGTIILGCSSAADHITANSYSGGSGGVKVADGQILTDGTNYYSGTLTDTQISAIAGKTLQPFVPTGVTLETVGEELTATLSSTSLDAVNIPAPITVDAVTYNRTFSINKPATVMLPFSKNVSDFSGGTFYTYGGVEKENDKWVATMNEVTGSIEANTPYLVMPTDATLTFSGNATLNTTGGGSGQTADQGSLWTFKGTYNYIKWTTDTSDPDYTAERAAEIGQVYGFAGVQKEGIEVGDFVKVASGAKIRPMSAYLMWSNKANQAPARTGMKAATATADELPQSITVRLLGASGTVTNVGEIDTTTGEISFEGWYTLQGVKLEAEPTEPGIYINNGKTVSIQK